MAIILPLNTSNVTSQLDVLSSHLSHFNRSGALRMAVVSPDLQETPYYFLRQNIGHKALIEVAAIPTKSKEIIPMSIVNVTLNTVFTKQNGARDYVPKTVFLLCTQHRICNRMLMNSPKSKNTKIFTIDLLSTHENETESKIVSLEAVPRLLRSSANNVCVVERKGNHAT